MLLQASPSHPWPSLFFVMIHSFPIQLWLETPQALSLQASNKQQGADECLRNNDPIFMQMSLVITKKWRAISSILEAQAELFLKVDCFSKFSIRCLLLKYSPCAELFPTWGASLIHMHDGSLARDAIRRSASHLRLLWSGERRQGGSAGRKHAADCSWASNGIKYLRNKASQTDSWQNKDTIEAKCSRL